MAACFVYPWGSHFLASELPRRHLIMFGFSFNSFLLITTFFWWPCFYSYSFMSQQNLSNKRNFPEHFHLEFSGFFRGSMPLIAAVLIFIKKTAKTRQELMGRLRQAAVDAGQPEELGCCGFRDGQLMSNEWPFSVIFPKKGSQELKGKHHPNLSTFGLKKHLGWGVFWRVFLRSFFFFTAKATSFSWTPNGIWEHLISLRRNSTLIQEKDPPPSSNIYQLNPFPPTEGAGTAADLSWVESMIFSEPSPGFGGIGFRTVFLEGNPPEKLTWNLKKVQIRKRKKQFPSKVSIFFGFLR